MCVMRWPEPFALAGLGERTLARKISIEGSEPEKDGLILRSTNPKYSDIEVAETDPENGDAALLYVAWRHSVDRAEGEDLSLIGQRPTAVPRSFRCFP